MPFYFQCDFSNIFYLAKKLVRQKEKKKKKQCDVNSKSSQSWKQPVDFDVVVLGQYVSQSVQRHFHHIANPQYSLPYSYSFIIAQ